MSGSSIEIELPDDMTIANTTATISDSMTDGIADLSSKFLVLDSS